MLTNHCEYTTVPKKKQEDLARSSVYAFYPCYPFSSANSFFVLSWSFLNV